MPPKFVGYFEGELLRRESRHPFEFPGEMCLVKIVLVEFVLQFIVRFSRSPLSVEFLEAENLRQCLGGQPNTVSEKGFQVAAGIVALSFQIRNRDETVTAFQRIDAKCDEAILDLLLRHQRNQSILNIPYSLFDGVQVFKRLGDFPAPLRQEIVDIQQTVDGLIHRHLKNGIGTVGIEFNAEAPGSSRARANDGGLVANTHEVQVPLLTLKRVLFKDGCDCIFVRENQFRAPVRGGNAWIGGGQSGGAFNRADLPDIRPEFEAWFEEGKLHAEVLLAVGRYVARLILCPKNFRNTGKVPVIPGFPILRPAVVSHRGADARAGGKEERDCRTLEKRVRFVATGDGVVETDTRVVARADGQLEIDDGVFTTPGKMVATEGGAKKTHGDVEATTAGPVETDDEAIAESVEMVASDAGPKETDAKVEARADGLMETDEKAFTGRVKVAATDDGAKETDEEVEAIGGGLVETDDGVSRTGVNVPRRPVEVSRSSDEVPRIDVEVPRGVCSGILLRELCHGLGERPD